MLITELFLKINFENLYYLAATLGVVVIVWYTIETYLLRINSEKQLRAINRPVLAFTNTNREARYELVNTSKNPALNIFVFSKRFDGFYFNDDKSCIIGVLPGDKVTDSRLKYYDKEKQVTKKRILKSIPSISKLLDLVDDNELERGKTSLVAIYEDSLGNKIFTILHESRAGDFEELVATGYIDDLKKRSKDRWFFVALGTLMVLFTFLSIIEQGKDEICKSKILYNPSENAYILELLNNQDEVKYFREREDATEFCRDNKLFK